ncbi:MAG: DUF296 domain-containing protein [archaeon]
MVGLKQKNLVIELEDGEKIVPSLESALKEHEVGRALLQSIQGRIRSAKLGMFVSGRHRIRHYLESLSVKTAFGDFTLDKSKLVGNVNVCLEKDIIHSVSGVLLEGEADGSLTITLRVPEKVRFA